MQRIMAVGLLKIELPTGSVRLCDGGTVTFDGETYVSRDPVFGVVKAPEAIEEGVGDQAPAFSVTLLPAPSAAASDLSRADFQGSRLRAWIAEIDADTGLVDGDPELEVDAAIDITTLHLGEVRELEIACVSSLERIFVRNKGNSLNGQFHKRIYPGETGLDNANGVTGTFAWGANAPPRGQSGASGSAGALTRLGRGEY